MKLLLMDHNKSKITLADKYNYKIISKTPLNII